MVCCYDDENEVFEHFIYTLQFTFILPMEPNCTFNETDLFFPSRADLPSCLQSFLRLLQCYLGLLQWFT